MTNSTKNIGQNNENFHFFVKAVYVEHMKVDTSDSEPYFDGLDDTSVYTMYYWLVYLSIRYSWQLFYVYF